MRLFATCLAGALVASACNESEPAKPATEAVAEKRTPTSAEPAPRAAPAEPPTDDTFTTERGKLRVVPILHGMLRLELGELSIYVDPHASDKIPDAPKADLILITDIHPDHFDPPALAKVQKSTTRVVAPPVVAEKVPGAIVMFNGQSRTVAGIPISAVPMYNLKRGPKPGTLFHDKGRGNGYLLNLGGKRVYVSGDTECTEEMRALTNIDVAFVCMNLPYTMPPEEALECIKAFRPKVVYPYHYRGSDLSPLVDAALPGVEVRRREWYPGGA